MSIHEAGFVAAAAFPTLLILGNLPDDLTARLIAGAWLGIVGIAQIVWWATGALERVLELREDLRR